MKVVPAIHVARQVRGMVGIACGGVKVNHRVEAAARPYPMVHRLAGPLGFRSRVEGSTKRRDGCPVHAYALGMSAEDDLPVSTDHVLCRGVEVAPAFARANVIYPLEDHQPTNAGLRRDVEPAHPASGHSSSWSSSCRR